MKLSNAGILLLLKNILFIKTTRQLPSGGGGVHTEEVCRVRGHLPPHRHRRRPPQRPRAHLRGGGEQQGGEVHEDAGPAAQLRPAEHHGLQDGRQVGCLDVMLIPELMFVY